LDVDVQTENVVAGRNLTVVVKSEAVYRLVVTKPTDQAARPLSIWTENVSTEDGCFEGKILKWMPISSGRSRITSLKTRF